MNHLKGYATSAEAERSKAAGLPGAWLDDKCPCGLVHVKQAKTVKAATFTPRAKPGSMTSAVSLVLSGEATVAEAARRFEVDEGRLYDRAWSVVKAAVFEFWSWTCLACGEMACDVHHRQRKGIGGSGDPVISHGRVNLVPLCRRDHDRCHAEDPEMRDRGFMLGTDQDPARYPVVVSTEHGYQILWLLPNGETADTSPYEEAEAA